MLLLSYLCTLLLPTFLLLSPIHTQDQGQNYLQSLVQALQGAGLTELASAAVAVASTSTGQQLFSRLPSGNYTIFAPSDAALRNVPANVTNDPEMLAQIISYHIVLGDLTNTTSSSGGGGRGGSTSCASVTSTRARSTSETSTSPSTTSSEVSSTTDTSTSMTATSAAAVAKRWNRKGSTSRPPLQAALYPNVTIGRTLLNSTNWVILEGNKSQVLAWTRYSEDENVTILNQATSVNVTNAFKWRNLFINRIDAILTPPGNVSTALTALNATVFQRLASQITVPFPNGTNGTVIDLLQSLRGFTFFLPNNAALTAENNLISALQNNQSALAAVFSNHIINGTTVYSPTLWNGASSPSNSTSTNYTSAGGENLSFSSNATGLFINGGNSTSAQIVRSDALVMNGVIHVIDRVLVDTNSNPSAASSAYESATSAAAAQTTTETGAVGVSSTPTTEASVTTQETSTTATSTTTETSTTSAETSTTTATSTTSA